MTYILELQSGLCSICHRPFTTYGRKGGPSFDHVVSRCAGGGNRGNRLVAHKGCNNKKGHAAPTRRELQLLAYVNAALGVTPTAP